MRNQQLTAIFGGANSFDSAGRSFIVYRTAGSWPALDPPGAVRLHRDSFAYALELAVNVREQVEDAIQGQSLLAHFCPSEQSRFTF
jgi:hypothetical protein